MAPISHAIADIMRRTLSKVQADILAADDIPEMTKFRLIAKISDEDFRLIDELEGVVR